MKIMNNGTSQKILEEIEKDLSHYIPITKESVQKLGEILKSDFKIDNDGYIEDSMIYIVPCADKPVKICYEESDKKVDEVLSDFDITYIDNKIAIIKKKEGKNTE